MSDMTSRVAAAMFNAPDPTEPDARTSSWPPSHPEDVAWWLTRAQAAINAVIGGVHREVRMIPCWAPLDEPFGGEFDLDGLSHRKFVLETIANYGKEP